jgi:hypothetical protein
MTNEATRERGLVLGALPIPFWTGIDPADEGGEERD